MKEIIDAQSSSIGLQPSPSCTKTNPGSPFYFRLCRNIKDDVWNSNQAMGQNTLSKFVKTMCRKAGKDRRKTNHSARKTTVTLLVNAEVPPIYPSFANTICGHKNVPFYIL